MGLSDDLGTTGCVDRPDLERLPINFELTNRLIGPMNRNHTAAKSGSSQSAPEHSRLGSYQIHHDVHSSG